MAGVKPFVVIGEKRIFPSLIVTLSVTLLVLKQDQTGYYYGANFQTASLF